MRKILAGTLALLLLGACTKKNAEIVVELKGLDNTKAVLNRLEAGTPVSIDTVETKDGKFTFEIPKSHAQLLLISIENKQEPIAFFGGDGDVSISGSADDLAKVSIDGGEMTELFEKFTNEIPKLDRSKALREDYIKAQMAGDTAGMMALQKEYETISSEQVAYFKTMLDTNGDNAVGAFLALEMAGSLESDKLQAMINKFEVNLKNHPYVTDLKKVLESLQQMEKLRAEQEKAMENIAEGKPAPDFTLTTINGKQISLASFKGKYLLIDFWASWCAPCRQENPNVLKLNEKFSKKGLEILSISTDEDEAKWKEAIAADKLTWNQARDTDGKVSSTYVITAIPTTFLINPDGVIVAVNLRGEELMKKLNELIK